MFARARPEIFGVNAAFLLIKADSSDHPPNNSGLDSRFPKKCRLDSPQAYICGNILLPFLK
ncbi:MAG TPA: hypothetical protein VHS96_05275, partial [Bacteroidia bacterium]|nr:hypothetical protein [Bacteroidia bacterium]